MYSYNHQRMATASVSSRPLRALKNPRIRRQWIVLLYTLALAPLPLVGTLGYENSLALTALFSLLGAAVGVDVIRELRTTPKDKLSRTGPRTTVLLAAARIGLSEIAWLLAISLGVMFGTLVITRNCDPLGGLTFFLTGPACSAGLGWVCGLWGGVLHRKRSLQLLLAYTPIFGCLGLALWRLYYAPVVFAFDPFWGYFSGPLYDENVRVDARYLWYRAYNALAATAALAAFFLWTDRASQQIAAAAAAEPAKSDDDERLSQPRKPKARNPLTAHPWVATLTFVTAAAAASFGMRPAHHGFTATVESLSEALMGVRETEHFVIHYAANSATQRDLEMIAAEHEFAWHELYEQLGRAPEYKIHSFVFPNSGLKRKLLGAGRTEVAPPWRGHIYLNHLGYPHRVLQHELAHAFSAMYGDPTFGVSGYLDLKRGFRLNMAMVEGFATALAPRPRDGLDLHDQAAVLERLGKRPELESIMGLGFWKQASRRAYTAAGSFSLWLLETRGAEPLTRLYASGGDVMGTYGVPVAQLEAEWLEFLAARPIDEHDIETQRERFRRRSIFRRPCAHYVANLQHDARLAEARGQVDEGLTHLRTLCGIEPQQPSHRLRLANLEAREQRYEQALATLDGASELAELTATTRSVIDERRGDIGLLLGDLEAAHRSYEAALATPGLNASRTRTLQLKWYAASDPRLVPSIIGYFLPFERHPNLVENVTTRLYSAVEIAAYPEYGPLSDYLVGRQLLNARASEEAITRFESSLAPEAGERPLPSNEFIRAALLSLVEAYTRTRDYERARDRLKRLKRMPGSTSGQRLSYDRWQRRIDFLSAYLPASAVPVTGVDLEPTRAEVPVFTPASGATPGAEVAPPPRASDAVADPSRAPTP